MNIFRRNKIPLTDRRGKTIYVNKNKVDAYVLTAHGWLLKEKRYPMEYVSGKVVITGWEVHLNELSEMQFHSKYNSPEQLAKRKIYMESPECKAKMHESIMRDMERYGVSEEAKKAQKREYENSLKYGL